MFCKFCGKEVQTYQRTVEGRTQTICKRCGQGLGWDKPETINVPEVTEVPESDQGAPVGYACDFGKYNGKSFSDIPTDYLKKHCLKHYADNEDVTTVINQEIESRNE